ncbi:tRNA uridine-5-carboxymethylaminomethyl(34) synthesis enzyme MnmG [Halobacteriovorax sp. GB3]|uniref:tRNA uridine-5-carboxymethylaminomethyl(34) synthesis enzyme MnmG n=1 Tax=Halobacteriovorax sp. GB3 TaxID=2719615 RepID=UPI002361695C|nr:tRNA uridine-5-carboxymethylaminomethyl(34) synthesis enzyme MnmG [Halobacteriovorax sp. GB3]MDD0854734.1 tRNA uridine-5-carboxymethylaminomethyl(34) synthesis enzyme MnmG [Halobacteriovorax sp. GB3]
MSEIIYDVMIVGGGHAGCEAAWVSSQFGLSVAILTMPEVPLASTPCNPAVGGVGKGQVVRELDALGGMMGIVADRSAIQYRILNESKGYAVQSTRVQVDKDLYSENAEKLIASVVNIDVIREKVDSIARDGELFHVETSNRSYRTKKLVMTTGTFLNGKLHTGEEQTNGGRVDCNPSKGLSDLFSEIQTLDKRFKTGTPARLDKDTIDFSVMVAQESDGRTRNFHLNHEPNKRFVDQVACHLTRTNENTLGIIRDNKERSPIFNGQIQGIGPRYCPSIEDKAFRYPDRHSHHVFVEPEGLNAQTIYPNGVSTSLPKEVQLEFLRTIAGLEKVEILVYGYAVEYDVVDTSKLNTQLEYIDVPGLYFAGQVNGTSGYEEAAGQGIVAGINASLSVLGREPLHLDRNSSYIGVMVEDLVSNKRDEPYRLFTARSENRLYVREDNSVLRMYPFRKQLGLYTELDKTLDSFVEEFELLWDMAKSYVYKANPKNKEYFKEMGYGTLPANTFMFELIKRSQLEPVETLEKELLNFGLSFREDVVRTVAISLKYEGYIERANFENEKVIRLSGKKIQWQQICDSVNISNECRQRILEVKPETFGGLQKIDGIRPATLAYVAGNLL